jgi:TetR/AcrR family transcriptional repressor of nem operon
MARPREFDIDQVLDAAIAAFWTQGYEATSMTDLMEVMDLKKGSIYKAFVDKHDLFMKALQRYLDGMHQGMRQALEGAASPWEGIRAWLQMGVEMCEGQEIQRGCLALNSAVELGPHDEEVAKLLKRGHGRMIGLLISTIKRGQALGEFRTDLTAEQLARGLHVFGAGMLTTSKALHQDELDSTELAEFVLGLLT